MDNELEMRVGTIADYVGIDADAKARFVGAMLAVGLEIIETSELTALRAKVERYEMVSVELPEAAWAIHFEDADCKPEIFVGCGAEEAARHRYAQLPDNWNCHLLCDATAALRSLAVMREENERLERSEDQLITERDEAIDAADRLACAIGTVEEIGEHTSCNNPWEQAHIVLLDKLESLALRTQERDALAKALATAAEALRTSYDRDTFPDGTCGEAFGVAKAALDALTERSKP